MTTQIYRAVAIMNGARIVEVKLIMDDQNGKPVETASDLSGLHKDSIEGYDLTASELERALTIVRTLRAGGRLFKDNHIRDRRAYMSVRTSTWEVNWPLVWYMIRVGLLVEEPPTSPAALNSHFNWITLTDKGREWGK